MKREEENNQEKNKEKNKQIKATQVDCSDAIISEEYADLIVQYEENITATLLRYNAECYQIINDKYAIIHPSLSEEALLQEVTEFDVNIIPRLLGAYGVSSIEASGMLAFHEQLTVNLRGEGIILGFIDSGIDYTHPVFINEDNTSKILNIWDQTIQSENPPRNFQYGTEYNMDDINNAINSEDPYDIVPSVDETGHGTFLAGIAAGRQIVEEDFVGAAPDSEIIMVKLKRAKRYLKELFLINEDAIVYQDTDIMMGVKYLTQKSISYGRPLVICIGLGTNQGAHDGTSVIEEYLDNIAVNYVVVIATGNEATLGHHQTGFYDPDLSYQDIQLSVAPNEKGLGIQLWAQAPDVYSVGVISPSGELVARIPPRLGRRKEIELLLERSTVYIQYELLEEKTGDSLVLIQIREPTEGLWIIRVFGDVVVIGAYHMWLEREGWISPETRFLNPSPYMTLTIPSTAINPIAVGAYNHFNDSLYIASGRGWTRNNWIKPDLVAPGVNVLGPVLNNEFGTMTGTSISAAHVAGAAALLLEWGIIQGNNPDINTTVIKKTLLRGAQRKEELDYPNREWGYGTLNLFNSFEIIRG
ncbi:MAG: S8 family peptidase [Eubacteriales bacterium]